MANPLISRLPTPLEAPIPSPTPTYQRFPAVGADLGDNDAEGAVTASYLICVDKMLNVLDRVVATELTGWLSFTATSVAAHTVRADRVSAEFARCAEEHQATAQRVIRRITELGGKPELCPTELGTRSVRPFTDADTVPRMLEAQLAAERQVVEYYRDAIQWMGDRDPTSRRLLEDLLAAAEHAASELDHLTRAVSA